MTDIYKAAHQALSAIQKDSPWRGDTINTLRAALEQPQQEPVAWMCSNDELMHRGYSRFSQCKGGDWNIPVYTAPPPATWVWLTEEDMTELDEDGVLFARYIETKLREKNRGQK